MQSTLLSVCVPTYNGALYLKECLDSILAQTYKNFELLIVDDCSGDSTLAVAAEYAATDDRVKVIKNDKNLGLVGNWNRCVELASGEWIKFVFQDDIIHTTCLEEMLKVGLAGHPFVFSARNFIFDNGTGEEVQKLYQSNKIIVSQAFKKESYISPEKMAEEIIKRPLTNIIGEPTCVLLRKDLFYKYGFFNPNLIQKCDMEYWSRIGIKVGAAYIDQELVSFRVHENSTTMQNKKKLQLKFESLKYLYEFAFNPHYQLLRDLVKHSPFSVNFEKELRKRGQKILWQLLKQNKKEERMAWRQLTLQYPKLKKISQPNLVFLMSKIRRKFFQKSLLAIVHSYENKS